MKITQTILSFFFLAGNLAQSEAQLFGLDFIPPLSPNFNAVDFLGLVEFLKFIDIFGFFPTFINNGCRTLNTVPNFTPEAAEDFFSRPYFVQLVQSGEGFNREEQLNCVISDILFRDDLPNGYTLSSNPFAIDDDGNLIGNVDDSKDPPQPTLDPLLLCLVPTPFNPSKFIANVCFLPRFLGNDAWVVASTPDYFILTGGQPTINRGDGFCSNDVSGQNGGILIATPDTFPDESVLEEALAKAEELGLDTSVLLRTDQANTDGTPCDEFKTPRGVKIPVKKKK